MDQVVLGSACPADAALCTTDGAELPGNGSGSGDPTADSAMSPNGAANRDGGSVRADGGRPWYVPPAGNAGFADAGDALANADITERMQNLSFELTRGSFGALAYSPVDPVPLGLNLVEPWGACRTGFNVVESAESVRGSNRKDVLPRSGESFIDADLSFSPGRSGLRQDLAYPLRAGTRYSFLIDVRVSSDNEDGTLEIWSSQLDCLPTNKLAEITPISSRDWQTVCVSFLAPTDVWQLVLVPNVRSLVATSGRLFFDNIHSDESCH